MQQNCELENDIREVGTSCNIECEKLLTLVYMYSMSGTLPWTTQWKVCGNESFLPCSDGLFPFSASLLILIMLLGRQIKSTSILLPTCLLAANATSMEIVAMCSWYPSIFNTLFSNSLSHSDNVHTIFGTFLSVSIQNLSRSPNGIPNSANFMHDNLK